MTKLLPLLFTAALLAQRPDPPFQPSAAELQAIRARLNRPPTLSFSSADLTADVAIYFKAAEWILRHPEEFLTKAYYDNTLKLLDAGAARAKELEAGHASWPKRTGRVARAYRSKVDSSFQPYTVVVPESYDGSKPMRLDVILHGRNARLNEVSFLADAEFGKPPVPQPDRIELIIYGRTNNAYRWSGETDVFEALAAVERNYSIDRQKILLRGFSMGGAGTWHIGMHYPLRWAGLEAGAGFSETVRYAKQENAPEYQKRAFSIYDAYLYARNALNVPTVGYGSVDDPQLQASLNMVEQLKQETYPRTDLRALFLVGPKIGHRFAPESKQESEAFLTRALSQPRDTNHIRMVTYTTRYGEADWLRIDGLAQHYTRGELEAKRQNGTAQISAKGVTRLLFAKPLAVEIDGQSFKSVDAIERLKNKWQTVTQSSLAQLRKRHGLQGPIDDAFLDSFVCVRPTAEPRDLSTHQLAVKRLETFQADWDKYLRGDIRVKDDKDITNDDIQNNNLILFGDAKSNRLLARILPQLPMDWSAKRIKVAGKTFGGENQLLIAIYPNPLNPRRYVVLNSGHTFGAREFQGTNALLFPRLGDWAVLSEKGETIAAGFFDESWR